MTVRDSSRRAIKAVSAIWHKAGIPVRAAKHCIDKLEAVFAEWKGLQKHKSRTTGHKMKEKEFLERLNELFDIAHSDALDMITTPEDREFLIFQRQTGRPGSIGGIDKVETNRRHRVMKRKEKELERQKRSQAEQEACSSQAVESDDGSNSSAAEESSEDGRMKGDTDSGEESSEITARTARKKAKINIMSPGLTSTLDRTKVSSRNATFILSEVASSLGHDVNTLNISRNSIH